MASLVAAQLRISATCLCKAATSAEVCGGVPTCVSKGSCLSLLKQRSYAVFNSTDTVFALSSGHGKCGVSVIRATGPGAKEALLKLTNRKFLPNPRYAAFRRLQDPETRDIIDHALVLWFPGPSSFTGEDLVEFQTHGGPAVVLATLQALGKVKGCRHAEPGDFTKRAFFNGKLDLTEVEGLGDLIHAETEAQRKQALRQMEGDLGKLYQQWRTTLLKLVAHVEAVIDFSEEENIEEGVLQEVREQVCKLHEEIEKHLDDGRRGERLRSGVHVAIVGPPNAGKSSLLNILCQRPAAIVSPQAGTTRDVLESALDISGYPVVISDTAGLRTSSDPIEQEGIRRALKKAENADLKILIADMSLLGKLPGRGKHDFASLSATAYHLLGLEDSKPHPHTQDGWSEVVSGIFKSQDTLIVLNKLDLVEGYESCSTEWLCGGAKACVMSAKTGEGVDSFMKTLEGMLKMMCGNPLAGNPSITQARHRHHLELCSQSLSIFIGQTQETMSSDTTLDLAAEELRTSIRQLGHITGKVGVEDILDVVFRDFCIGK